MLDSWAHCARHAFNFSHYHTLLHLELHEATGQPSTEARLFEFIDYTSKMYNAGKKAIGVKGRPGAELGNGLHTWYNDSMPLGSISQSAINHLKDGWKRCIKKQNQRPKFKRKNTQKRMQISNADINTKNIKGNKIVLPKYNCSIDRGTLKLAEKVPYAHLKVSFSTITKEHNHWYISITFNAPKETLVRPTQERKPIVGVDLGISVYAATSCGEMHYMPDTVKSSQLKINAINSRISKLININLKEAIKGCDRCSILIRSFNQKKNMCHQCKAKFTPKLKSRNITRLRAKLTKLYKIQVNTRHYTSHTLTKSLCTRYDEIVIEDLKTKNMTKSSKGTIEEPGSRVKQKSGLNRSMLGIAPYKFRAQLNYKKKMYLNTITTVAPRNTSRHCPECGFTSKENRKSQSLFLCVNCGHTDNADTNASINIKDKGQEQDQSKKNGQHTEKSLKCKKTRKPHKLKENKQWTTNTLTPLLLHMTALGQQPSEMSTLSSRN